MSEPTLIDFLLARIAEDKAEVVLLRDRHPHDPGPSYLAANSDIIEMTMGWSRALAECEAKRAVVLEHQIPALRFERFGGGEVWAFCLRALALPYADHPDYRESWKP